MAKPTDRTGSRPLTFRGETAYYSNDELEEMRTLPANAEGEHVARLIHEGKVHGDATLIRSGSVHA